MTKRQFTPALLGLLLLPVLAFRFGGWAVITVDDLPEYVVAGTPVLLSFIVRQHGVTPLGGLRPMVTLKSGDAESNVAAVPGGERGHYVATITAPRAGELSVRIHSGFMKAENVLLPVRVIAGGAAAPRALAAAALGHQLFFAKGCVTCHVRGADGASGYKLAPDLTGKRYVADYVAKFLADPENSPIARNSGLTNVRMPNLNLKPREIASLVAFLNAEPPLLGKAVSR